jgi:hypothetical protein
MVVQEFIGKSHLLWVHLPVGFIFLALVLSVLQWKKPNPAYGNLLPFIWLLAFISAVFAVFSGLLLSWNQDGNLLFFHQYAGILLTAIMLAYVKYKRNFFLGFIALLFAITLHLGASLTHGTDYLFPEKRKEITHLEEADLFRDAVAPIFKAKCVSCHKPGKMKGELDLTSYEKIADKGEIRRRINLPKSHKEFMPADGKAPLSKEQTAILTFWVEVGAPEYKPLHQLKLDAKKKALFESFFQLNEDPLLALNVAPAATKQIQKLREAGFQVAQIYRNSPLLEVKYIMKKNPPVKLLFEIKDQLVWLQLPHSSLKDRDLTEIGKLTGLFKLNIGHNKITDQGIMALGNLKNLRTLNVYGTGINKKGLNACLTLPFIRKIYLWDTHIDSSYLAELQKKHRKVDFIYKMGP